MLTNDERRTLEVLEAVSSWKYVTTSDPEVISAIYDGLIVYNSGFNDCQLTPAGRAELNRLRAKEIEASDEN